jgi:hypothetical protein
MFVEMYLDRSSIYRENFQRILILILKFKNIYYKFHKKLYSYFCFQHQFNLVRVSVLASSDFSLILIAILGN